MVGIQVSVTLAAESGTRFEQVLRQVVDEAGSCSGCVRDDWFRSPDSDRQVFVYGESDEAFAECRQPLSRKSLNSCCHFLKRVPRSSTFARRSWSRVDRIDPHC